MTLGRRRFLTGTTAGALLLATSAQAGAQASATDVDTGFCRDMSAHHVQALSMCQRVLGRDTGGAVQAAAAEVLQNQAIEIGQMRAWLTDWGQSTVPPTVVMAWMGANDGAGIPLASMPGYAADAELFELSTLTGRSRGKRWIELMRAHHVGGVTMATQAIDRASASKVIRLATTQVAVQTFEIEQYDLLLATSYL